MSEKRKVLFKEPLVEIVKLSSTESAPSSSVMWTEIPSSEIVQDSVAITPTAGSNSKLYDDEGGVAASYTPKTQYAVTVKTYYPLSAIDDVDGLVDDEYAIRISEKSTGKGYIVERSEVSCATGYDASSGQGTTYTFNALTPTTEGMLKAYTKTTATEESQSESQGE